MKGIVCNREDGSEVALSQAWDECTVQQDRQTPSSEFICIGAEALLDIIITHTTGYYQYTYIEYCKLVTN